MIQPVSMPWSVPVFPAPPHSWRGVKTAVFPFDPDPVAVQAFLPPALKVEAGPGLIALLSYGWGENTRTHPFNEAVVLVPVSCDGHQGNYVPFIYVTTDESLIAGREAAGWPKKLADITWERDGDHLRVAVTRWGETILTLEGDLNVDLPEGADLSALESAAGEAKPTFNYKLIPGPGEEIEIEEVTSTTLEILPTTIEIGMAKVIATSSKDDPIGAIVPSLEGPFVAIVSDNTIPRGTVLRQVEGRARR